MLNHGRGGHGFYLLVEEAPSQGGELFGVGAAHEGGRAFVVDVARAAEYVPAGHAPTSRAVWPAEEIRRTSGPRMRLMGAEMSG